VIGQVRSEALKIRSTRTTLGLVLTMIALVLLFVLLTGLLSDEFTLFRTNDQRDLLSIGSVSAIFAALAGALVVTSEYRFGTIRPTFLVTPRRWLVVGAKAAASMLTGAVLAAVGMGLSYGIGRLILSERDIPSVLDGSQVTQILVGALAAAALWGAIGVGLAAILRNQIASVVGLLVWVFLVENLLFGFVPSIGRFTPGRANDALMGLTDKDLLSPTLGYLVLVAWAAVLVAVGVALTSRRDVN